MLATYFVGLRLIYLNDLYQNKQGAYFKGGGGYLANFNLVCSKIKKKKIVQYVLILIYLKVIILNWKLYFTSWTVINL